MKRFDPTNIYQRMIEKLSQNPNWKAVVNDSVISSTMKTVAEEIAEAARYSEHMFKETRWDTAQNISSIAAAAGQLGYKPARRKSAFGTITISADPRIHLVGRTLPLSAINGTLSSWQVASEDIYLQDDLLVKDSAGNSYVIASRGELAAGAHTTTAVIIEGSKQSITMPVEVLRALATRSKLDPYIYIPIEIPSCEDASTPLTRRFFKVFTHYETYSEEYRVVDTLHLSSSDDADVEVYPDLYNPNILYLKFNASSVRGRVLNLSSGTGVRSIEVQYIESKGSSGNISKNFEMFTIVGTGATEGLKLFGINLEPITGGSDEESVFDIKKNAPKFYMNTYTVATREAYENAIKRIDFGDATYPTRVRVYAGTSAEGGLTRTVTKISMLLPNLEDRAVLSDTGNSYADIEKTINFYLSELKAPVDVLQFEPPNYVTYGIGLTCTASRSQVDNLSNLRREIRTLLDGRYGAQSTDLDFDRSIYAADIVALVKESKPSLLSVKLEMEATKLLNWNDVQRVRPYNDDRLLHTLRLPFSFHNVFRGHNYIKGFKDYQTGASYVMRFDIFYRQASTSTLPPYHSSIFIKEDSGRNKDAFYHVTDVGEGTSLWPADQVASTYPMKMPDVYYNLEDSYQFALQSKVYSDDAFENLIDPTNLNTETVSTTQAQTAGALDSYLVTYQSNVDDDEEDTVGTGYFEFDIAPLYSTLQTYATQDSLLATRLAQYPLAVIQCGTLDQSILTGFINDVLIPYVEIHVSMRPLDSDLIMSDSQAEGNVVLLIDSSDENIQTQSLTNLSQPKRDRFISVECSLV